MLQSLVSIVLLLISATNATAAMQQLKTAVVAKSSDDVVLTRKRKGSSKTKGYSKAKDCSKAKRRKQINQNKCSSCSGNYVDGEEDRWVGCDGCPRWFHKDCVSVSIVYNGNWNCGFH